jgi:hypothetical protein
VRKMVDKIAQQASSGGRARRGDNAQPANGADRAAELRPLASSEGTSGEDGEQMQKSVRRRSSPAVPAEMATNASDREDAAG